MNCAAAIAARRAHLPVGEQRKRWRDLIDTAAALSSEAMGSAWTSGRTPPAGSRPSAQDRLVNLAHLAREATHLAFPVDGLSAERIRRAFLEIARAFVETPSPERRAICAAPLASLAGALDELLHERDCAAATEAARRAGIRD